jgi:hypothetical protein
MPQQPMSASTRSISSRKIRRDAIEPRRAVQVPSAVVRYDHRIRPAIGGLQRVTRIEDALDHQHMRPDLASESLRIIDLPIGAAVILFLSSVG